MPGRKLVLFVCVENSFRSQIAEAFARIHGNENVEVYSAGSRPSGRVNPKAIDAMREIGYDLNAHASKSLAEVPDVESTTRSRWDVETSAHSFAPGIERIGACLIRRRWTRMSFAGCGMRSKRG